MNDWNIFKLETCNELDYMVSIRPEANTLFSSQLDNILEKYNLLLSYLNVKEEELVFAKIFVSDYLNQNNIIKEHDLFQKAFKNCGVSIIEQPPLDGSKLNILLWFIKGIKLTKYKSGSLFYLETNNYLHIFHCIRCSSKAYASLTTQTVQALIQHKYLIRKYGMDIANNCIKTWVYIRNIDKDYSDITKGENEFFGNNGLNTNTHFVSFTGVEGNGECEDINLCLDVYSVKGLEQGQIKYLKALNVLDNTHKYGSSLERGICITYDNIEHIFISGTASVDEKDNCIHVGDIMNQIERIFLNIQNLLHEAEANLNDVGCMIVYLRDISDFCIVNDYIKNYYSKTPYVIVKARIGKPEWLIEIECLALKKIQ